MKYGYVMWFPGRKVKWFPSLEKALTWDFITGGANFLRLTLIYTRSQMDRIIYADSTRSAL